MPGTVKSGLLPDADRSHKCDCQDKGCWWLRHLLLDKGHFITALNEIDVRNFELLSFNEETDQNGYKLMLYGEMNNGQGNDEYAFIDMIVHYSSSKDMFNELAGESWFEIR